jgi:hypothetical protein
VREKEINTAHTSFDDSTSDVFYGVSCERNCEDDVGMGNRDIMGQRSGRGGGRRPSSCVACVDGEHDVEELGLTGWDLGPKGASLY